MCGGGGGGREGGADNTSRPREFIRRNSANEERDWAGAVVVFNSAKHLFLISL